MRQNYSEGHEEWTTDTALQVQNQTDVEAACNVEEDSADTAAELIENLSRAIQKRKRALAWYPVPAITFCAAPIIVRLLLQYEVTGVSLVYWALLAAFMTGATSLFAILFSGVRHLNRAVQMLSGTDDVHTVGVMAESLSLGEPVLSIAGAVLIRLLPQLKREDLESLKPAQRSALCEGLLRASTRLKHMQYNPTLAVAILQAFERIGGETELPVVEKLAARKAVTPEQRTIRTAAESCLSTIMARIAGRTDVEPYLQQPAADVSLSAEMVETLSTRLRSIARIRRRNVAVTAVGSVFGTALAILSMSRLTESHHAGNILMAGMFASLATMIFFAFSGTYTQRNLTNALIHSTDMRIVPPLIQAAATVEISGTAAVLLLTRLLPGLRASDADLLNADDRALLHTAMLKHAGNGDFVLAALKALQQIGDAASIPTVQRLSERTYWRAANPAVREAAIDCLEYLKQRAALTEANQTLLRASSASAAPTDTLLRAIEGSGISVSDELLRTTSPPTVYVQCETEDVLQNVQEFAPQPSG